MRTSLVRMLAIVALPTMALAACGSSSKSSTGSSDTTQPAAVTTTTSGASTNAKATVALADNETIGKKVLVDSDGMTLYIWENDKTPGKASCTGACAQAWPPVVVTGTPTYGAGLTASKFSTVDGPNGEKQLAIDGHPLYRWVNDKKAGDATGQDVNGFYVVGADGKQIESSDESKSGDDSKSDSETATTISASSTGDDGY
jgi:predicted lipoprotein with Yx(FWY)xxD motif